MTLHLIKLCVGADSLADLREWMAARMAEARRRRAPLRHAHVTRMAPKRAADILDDGSLYWVIKGQIGARQRLSSASSRSSIRPGSGDASCGSTAT